MSDAQGRPEPDPPTAADAFAAEEAGPVPAGGKVGDEEADGAGGASQAAGTGEEVDTDSAAEVTLEGATAAEASLEAREVPTAEELRVRLLGRRLLALGTARHDRLLDVIGTALITVVATLLRVVRLGVPNTLVFDETFYVKDAWTLWRLGFEARWPVDPNPAFEAGEVFTYLEEAAYVVHPQVGKWLIGLGIDVGGGATNPA
ncbi:MAG: phospholipid carrier-dependent glycosyltransferase, partial [Promicromonosporaceae bacterium]|nr:phospholipid carrier-dependent glycosyltransferase [Promicromonosporaceae bacterium]